MGNSGSSGSSKSSGRTDSELNFAGKDGWSKWQNGWDKTLEFEVDEGFAIKGVASSHDNKKEDRRWVFKQSRLPGFRANRVDSGNWPYSAAHQMRERGDVRIDTDSDDPKFITGVQSDHDNREEDRTYKIREGSLNQQYYYGTCRPFDEWSKKDKTLKLECPDGMFLTEFHSKYESKAKDRVFKGECCTLTACHDDCETCSGPGNEACVSCWEDFEMSADGICVCKEGIQTGIRQCSECPEGQMPDETRTQCVNLNECADESTYNCPANSFCYDKDYSYGCKCRKGFTSNENNKSQREVDKDGVCYSLGLLMDLKTSNNGIQLDMTGNTGDSDFSNYEVNISQWNTMRTVTEKLDGFPKKTWRKHKFDGNGGLPSGAAFLVEVAPYRNGNPDYALKVSETVVIKCGCEYSEVGNGKEQTGSPGSVEATQENGALLFSWTDRSRCEEYFSFYRLDGKQKVGFVDDFYYAASDTCGRKHSPVHIQDTIQSLTVGSTHTYCIEAGSHNSPQYPYTSAPACRTVQIKWEASVTGRVALEETSGGFPVGGVQISWSLANGKATGTTQTDASGLYHIHIISDEVTAIEQDLTIQLSKTSGNGQRAVSHKFLCDNIIPCTEKSITLSHMTFNRVLDFIDDTTVPFTGSVHIANTEHAGLEKGCPMYGIQVCLHDHHNPGLSLVCDETDGQGKYELPAVLGMVVTVALRMPGINGTHSFERVADGIEGTVMQDTDGNFVETFAISEDKVWESVDYQDVTMDTLNVEVAGGLCKRPLGTSTVHIGYPSCPTWVQEETLTHTGKRITVPAQVTTVRFDQVVRDGEVRAEVAAYLGATLGERRAQTIDLRDLTEVRASIAPESEAEQSVSGNTDECEEHKGRFVRGDELYNAHFYQQSDFSLSLSVKMNEDSPSHAGIVSGSDWGVANCGWELTENGSGSVRFSYHSPASKGYDTVDGPSININDGHDHSIEVRANMGRITVSVDGVAGETVDFEHNDDSIAKLQCDNPKRSLLQIELDRYCKELTGDPEYLARYDFGKESQTWGQQRQWRCFKVKNLDFTENGAGRCVNNCGQIVNCTGRAVENAPNQNKQGKMTFAIENLKESLCGLSAEEKKPVNNILVGVNVRNYDDDKGEECAEEGGVCECAEGRVSYGVNGVFTSKYTLESISCSNEEFDDPMPGKTKKCYCATQGEECAEEGGVCECSGRVSYGVNGVFSSKSTLESISCSNEEFDDPMPGQTKKCYCRPDDRGAHLVGTVSNVKMCHTKPTPPTPAPTPDPRLETVGRLQFLFHPRPTLDVSFSGSPISECKNHDGDMPLILPRDREFVAKVFVTEEFGDNIEACDVVEGEVKVINKVGEDQEYVDELIATGRTHLQPAQLERLVLCNDKPCVRKMEYEQELRCPANTMRVNSTDPRADIEGCGMDECANIGGVASTIEACRDLCDGDCLAFTFIPSHPDYPGQKVCKRYTSRVATGSVPGGSPDQILCAVVHDSNEEELPELPKKKAHVAIHLLTGQPEMNKEAVDVNNPYTKLFQASMQVPGHDVVFVSKKVIVTGDRPLEAGSSISVPKYKPLMTLRDPPGGSSFAMYKDSKADIDINVVGVQPYVGSTGSFGGGAVVKLGTDMCAGFGVEMCITMSEIKSKNDLAYVHEEKHTYSNWDDDYTTSINLGLHFTYQTAAGPGNAGRRSDVFLLPALNIQFLEVRVVRYNMTACEATSTTEVRWSLEKSASDTMEWVTTEDINIREIPEVKKLLEVETGKPEEEQDAQKIEKLQEALDGWTETLAAYADVNARAAAGTLERITNLADGKGTVAPVGWFYKAQEFDHAMPDQAQEWVDPAAKFANMPRRLLGKPAPEALDNDLDEVYHIKFTGGGSKYEFHMTKSYQKLGADGTSSVFTDGFDMKSLTEFKALGFGMNLAINTGGRFGRTETRRRQTGDSESTDMGFVLQDPDAKDNFVIAVYLDPTYDTFVFHTVGGYSSCPHEAGTVPRNIPNVQILKQPMGPVLPDQPAVFEILLKNDGLDTSTYQFYRLGTDEANGSEYKADGAWFPMMLEFMPAESSVRKTVTVRRGPTSFASSDGTVGLRSMCEMLKTNFNGNMPQDLWADSRVDLHVDWMQPCSTVQMAGSLLDEQTFLVNHETATTGARANQLRLVARNPNVNQRKWANDTRLEYVVAEYRALGEPKWSPCLDVDGGAIEVQDEESDFGYATAYWFVGPLPDGAYQVRWRTVCTPSGSDPPPGMDSYSSEFISGTIDRVPPVQFGLVEPADQEYYPGDEVSVQFDEPIRCMKPFIFDVQLEVDGVDRLFNKDNLVIVCEGRKIQMNFKASVPYDEVMARRAKINFVGVQDRARNLVQQGVEATFSFADLHLDKVAVEMIGLLVKRTWKNDMANKNSTKFSSLAAEVVSEVAAVLQSDTSRFNVTEIRRATETSVEVDLFILPPPANDSGARRLRRLLSDDRTATALAALLDGILTSGAMTGSLAELLETAEPHTKIHPAVEDEAAHASGASVNHYTTINNIGSSSSSGDLTDLTNQIAELKATIENSNDPNADILDEIENLNNILQESAIQDVTTEMNTKFESVDSQLEALTSMLHSVVTMVSVPSTPAAAAPTPAVVAEEFSGAIVVKPAVMFEPDMSEGGDVVELAGLYEPAYGYAFRLLGHKMVPMEGQLYYFNSDKRSAFSFNFFKSTWVLVTGVDPRPGADQDLEAEGYAYGSGWGDERDGIKPGKLRRMGTVVEL